MRTTVDLDEHLLAEAKSLAARTKRTLGQVVNDALRTALVDARPAKAQRVVLKTYGGSGFQPGVDLDDKEALAEILGENQFPNAAD
ncbi:MAG: type II toxin-antitoxin system VapB family antitoxin [Actinomycetota bacterium]